MGSKGFAPVPHNNERPRQMPLYEHIYLARQDVTSQQVEALTETLKGIIEAHGGRIWAENRKSSTGTIQGARFVFSLPLR